MLKIFGEEYSLKAEVIEMQSFSAHADQNDLMDFVKQIDKTELQNIFLVHGEVEEQNAFSQALNQAGYRNIAAPKKGDTFNI